MLLGAWRERVKQAGGGPEPRLLIVPRHPQRFDEVAHLIDAQGWRVSRRSSWVEGSPPASALEADVWLGDSLGEMPAYYACADIGLLGGSFAPLGGQNLIEAAACGCPLVLGPSTFNFSEAAEQGLAAGAAWRVSDVDEACRFCLVALRDGRLEASRASALTFSASHRGAARRIAAAIGPFLHASE